MLTLTPKEREVVLHRLGVPDAIAEALTDAFPGESPVVAEPFGYVQATADSLRIELEKRDTLDDEALRQPAVQAILADCIDGSTFFSGVEMDLTARRASAIKTMRSLKAKLESVGCKVGEIPIVGA